MRNENYKWIKSSNIAFIVFTFWVTPAICSDDAYLQALEAEAVDSVGMNNTPPVLDVKKQIPAVKKGQKIEFESQLLKHFPVEYSATFETYKKLNVNDKAKVVAAYFASGKNITVSTKLLFNLYFGLGNHAR